LQLFSDRVLLPGGFSGVIIAPLMPLAPGTKLGPYEIGVLLGAGGMGEVYRAKDTRLERTVAIKILPAQLSADPVRKQRFEREAKTISSLNHPHICVLYDVGHQDGTDYLVMECVEGETLAKRLEKGPLPLEQVLKYGAQIADALDKAHRSGVVHRDLKPGNIMLALTGAKLLDFGLAKPVSPLASGMTLTADTLRAPMTEEGTIVGTFQYMSPEQVEGKELDGRSDIFSLGAVLYEMVTGHRAFEGKSQLSVASAILEKEPSPITAVKPMTLLALDHVIRKSLAKVPDDRWQSASDLESELKWIAELRPLTGAGTPTSEQRVWGWLRWVLALAATLAAALFGVAYLRKTPAEVHVVRSAIPPPEGGAFVFDGPVGGAFLSPDGRLIAFIGRVGRVTQLWVRPLDSLLARPLSGTEEVSFAFWSPDSRNLGFFAQGKLKRIAATGGPTQTLCDTESNRGASWSRNDIIVFARTNGEIQRIPASGGTPQRVTTLDASRHEGTHRWPYFLPDGKHFLFMAALLGPVSEDNVFYLGSLDGKQSRILFHGSSPIAYANGYLLYLAQNSLMARPFNPEKMDLTGEAVLLVEGVQSDPQFSNAFFSVSANGQLLYLQGKGLVLHSLVLFDRNGKQVSNLGESASATMPRFSPDARALTCDVISLTSGMVDLWVTDTRSGNRMHLATDRMDLASHTAVWSPDGTRVAYVSEKKTGGRVIYIKALNQLTPAQQRWETNDDHYVVLTDWAPDGKFLILTERPKGTGDQRVSLLPAADDGDAEPLLEVKGANVDSGEISPNGRWIAYRSDESGRNEIYISSFPKPTGKLQLSGDGGVTPRWKNDGKELYYLAPDKMLMAVELKDTGSTLQVASVRPLFELLHTMIVTGAGVNQYDVTGDGSRFVVVTGTTTGAPEPLQLVTNWDAELKK
jgi:dipeptidyl aminopeptidase/acylaminoacyl peptidase